MSERPNMSVPPARPRLRRALLAASASAAAVVMVLSAVGFGAYDWANRSRNTFTPPTESTGSTGPVAEDILGKCAERACNFLLLGSDSREGLTPEEQQQFGTDEQIGGENRSDTIILVHTRPGQREAIFLSFPRDLWVEIPGMGTGKINSAFEGGVDGGGPFRVARTVRELTGMPIHHVMYVSLAGFQGLVDALGGVNMCVPYPMFDELTGLDIASGCQEFDGATALAYVRTRHQPCDTIPDFARINRQQQFLRAVIAEILSPSQLVNLPSLVPELLDNLVVDEGLNVADLVYLAGTLQDVGTENADFRSVPSTPAGITVNGSYLSIVNAIEPDATELFRRIRENRPLGELGLELPGVAPSPANIVTAVVDRSGDPIAADVLDILTEGGFNTSPGLLPRSAVEPPTNGSIILYGEGAEPMARVVGTYFGNLELVPAPPQTLPDGVDVAVVVTGSYELPPEQAEEPVECPA
jgi:LCP family protein required for cell wall assembly